MDAGSSHDPGASAPPELLPKHIIFLSHSGQEKQFVEVLNQALLRVDHSPFFDQNEDSLPIGERFPDLIIRAAQQCRVAVIVLSPGYLTSKWPMLELVEFHKSMKDGNPIKLLPVFYKLKPDQIEIEKSEYMEKWVELFKQDEKQVEKCKDAVRALKAINGLIFEGKGHIKYMEKVVQEIWKLWPPPSPFDTSDMQGCDRMCKLMSELFKKHNGIHYLGIYGLHGSGKSKQCEAMCNYYFEEYAGKCYIVDLEDNKAMENQAKNKRELRKYLKDLVPIFLVVENVSQSSIKEAEFYVKAGYAHGSRVLVTSKNRSILKKLFGGPQYSDVCQPVPALNDIEAVQLVLAKGAPGKSITDLDNLEYKVVSDCCAKSCFDKQYHPSFLIAVASYFERTVGGDEIAKWEVETSMKVHDVLRDVFRHVLLEYDNNLKRTAKLIFMDLALSDVCNLTTYMDIHPSWQWPEGNNYAKAILHISIMQYNDEDAETKVKKLQEMSFLKDSTTEVGVQDFYREFAWWLVKDKDREESNWYRIWSENEEAYGRQFVPGSDSATRVILVDAFEYISPIVHFQTFTKLVYLELVRTDTMQTLNLEGLSSLRVMKVKQCKDLKEIVCTCSRWWFKPNCYRMRDNGCLGNLHVAQLEDLPNLDSVSFAPHCPSLIILWIYDCPKVGDLFDLRYNECLGELVISSCSGEELYSRELEDMMKLTELRTLDIGAVIRSTSIESINVSKLVHLVNLDLCGAKMTRIEGLCKLRHLTALGLYGCSELLELPNLDDVTGLECLCISHCYKLAQTFSRETVPPRVRNFHALGDKCNLDDHECLNPGWERELQG